MERKPGKGVVSREEMEQHIANAIRTLDDRWVWMRDRVGIEEWQRLVRWRKAWVVAAWLYRFALVVAIYWLILFFAVAGYALLTGKPFPPLARLWPASLAPLAVSALRLAVWVVECFLRRRLERLLWVGRELEAIQDALWADHRARQLEAERPQILAKAELARARVGGRPWWRVELSGLHLILWGWIGGVVLRIYYPRLGGDWAEPVLISGVYAWLLKGCFLFLLLFSSPVTRLRLLRFYRWCGTPKGMLLMLVLIPASFIALALVTVGIMNLLGM